MIKKTLSAFIWAIFGNNDDPKPPAWYEPKWPEWRRKLYWFVFRNPLHNFTFYVIGIADKPFKRVALYPKAWCPTLVFRVEGGWYIAVIHYKWLRLPFISYQGEGFIKSFYLGWRERGNLGAKLTLRL